MVNAFGGKFDVIVVGAGPAGTTTAYLTAKAGLDVLLLERGPFPGSKNVGGGALYAEPVGQILPGFWEDAPLERPIVVQEFWSLTEDSATTVGFRSKKFARPPYNRYAALKAKFDRWYASKAVEAGALLVTNSKADSLLFQRGKVFGVRTYDYPYTVHPVPNATKAHSGQQIHETTITNNNGKEIDYFADVVVLAEGVNALLATKSGLIPSPRKDTLSVYAKEVISLPPKTIEERFGLGQGEGAIVGLYGFSTKYAIGTSAIYTNIDSIGINVGGLIQIFQEASLNPGELLESIKQHPLIAPLIAGGKTVEYTAHLIPDGGFDVIPELVHPGLVIVGDAAGLVNGTHGINLAMFSGKFAAEAIIDSKKKNDFSKDSLMLYQKLMNDSFVIKDMKANRRAITYYIRRPYAFELFTKMLNHVGFELAMVRPIPKRERRKRIMRSIFKMQPPLALIRDAIDTYRTIR